MELGQLHPKREAGRERAGPSLGAPLVASPERLSPASWPCPHWCPGPRGQWNSWDSLPAQRKASVHTSPEPWLKWAPLGVDTAVPHCSSRHTTWAVARSRSASDGAPGQATPHLQAPSTGVLVTHQPGLYVSWRRRQF